MDAGLPTIVYQQPLSECWLTQHHESLGTRVVPAGKDSLAYHCVQHEKTQWLAKTATHCVGTLIWLDYGLLDMPGVVARHIVDFYRHVDSHPPKHVTIPTAGWPTDSPIDDSRPCWICAGSVLVMPSLSAVWWNRECVQVATTCRPTWEVNTWAKVARKHPDQVQFYAADHNATLLTGISH